MWNAYVLWELSRMWREERLREAERERWLRQCQARRAEENRRWRRLVALLRRKGQDGTGKASPSSPMGPAPVFP